ncbi:MAG: pyruvate kinase [Planctomycetes bacterium]|nr:pyruvate kinase [Planctomycetota bacterium]
MIRPKRTKIVATLGPASRDPETIDELIRSGVDVFRLNAAHADHDTLRRDVAAVRDAALRLGTAVGVLVDLQGPKIRIGSLENAEPIFLQRGEQLVLSCEPGVVGRGARGGEPARVGSRYFGLAGDVRPGERVLLDDGMIELKVETIDGTEISTRIVHGGLLKQHKGINLPGSSVSMSSLSEKDLADLAVVLELRVDFVAISFVRRPDDVVRLKELIRAANSDARVVAKIERPEAVTNFAAILEVTDAVMIARGDMGVELGPEVVPGVQKRIIRQAIEARKPVITATQMLESMITNPRPTRAEASDVANAIYDGTSAVMLSAETASGKFPVRAAKIMSRIVRRTESELFGEADGWQRRAVLRRGESVTLATVQAAAYAAFLADARLVAVFSESGHTAQLLAGERTETPVYVFTPSQRTVQRLTLVWGVTPLLLSRVDSVQAMMSEAEELLLRLGVARVGDTYAIVVGTSRRPGIANILKLRTVGDDESVGVQGG